MPRYKGDPRWITARYVSKCCKCDVPILKGDRAFYYPNGGSLYCGNRCGLDAAADFAAIAADDDVMSGQF